MIYEPIPSRFSLVLCLFYLQIHPDNSVLICNNNTACCDHLVDAAASRSVSALGQIIVYGGACGGLPWSWCVCLFDRIVGTLD